MPIEHEYKFILNEDNSELQEALEKKYDRQTIHQVYCTKNNRFRRITIRQGKKTSNVYVHTFKKKILGKILEVESVVSREDFELVLLGENISELHKTRFSIPQKHGQWDIDFLRESRKGKQYFALAECEQPEGLKIEVPKILRDFIQYEVPHEHSTWFSNFKLSDPTYASTAIETHKDLIRVWK